MRLNRYIALATGKSRRAADALITSQRVHVNNQPGQLGQEIKTHDKVTLDRQPLALPSITTIMLNKPPGYVCSRNGQGSQTIYELLPPELHYLKPVGRLDKDSSGLLLMTNDGQLANELTHPTHQKEKIYQVRLDTALTPADKDKLKRGIELEDGMSRLRISGNGLQYQVTMSEGRNRQIRRSFAALGYRVTALHRTNFGPFSVGDVTMGEFIHL